MNIIAIQGMINLGRKLIEVGTKKVFNAGKRTLFLKMTAAKAAISIGQKIAALKHNFMRERRDLERTGMALNREAALLNTGVTSARGVDASVMNQTQFRELNQAEKIEEIAQKQEENANKIAELDEKFNEQKYQMEQEHNDLINNLDNEQNAADRDMDLGRMLVSIGQAMKKSGEDIMPQAIADLAPNFGGGGRAVS